MTWPMTWIACRPVTSSDLPAIHAVLVETWHATYDRLYGAERVATITGQWHNIARLEQELAGAAPGTAAFWAGLWDGRIAATASARRLDDATVSLDRLYVRPSYQGLGLGTALMDAALAALGPARQTRLEADPGNTDAIEFYTRLGFERVGTTSDCGSGGFGIKADIYERIVSRP